MYTRTEKWSGVCGPSNIGYLSLLLVHIFVLICSVIIASNLFGELVVHVTGICDCQCSEKPVRMLSI